MELQFCTLFYMSVKSGLLHLGLRLFANMPMA